MTSQAQIDTSQGPTQAKAPSFLVAKLGPRGARVGRASIGAIVGGAFGFAYYAWIGCATGTCPISSNPVIATLYGALVGGLVAFS